MSQATTSCLHRTMSTLVQQRPGQRQRTAQRSVATLLVATLAAVAGTVATLLEALLATVAT